MCFIIIIIIVDAVAAIAVVGFNQSCPTNEYAYPRPSSLHWMFDDDNINIIEQQHQHHAPPFQGQQGRGSGGYLKCRAVGTFYYHHTALKLLFLPNPDSNTNPRKTSTPDL